MTHHTHPPFMSNTPRITTISSGRDGIHDDNHCWKKRASSNRSPIHSPKKLKLLALVQAIGLWLKKGGTKRPAKFGNVCMCPCIFGDWYFWATLMLLLAFLEAMAATLAGDFWWHPAFREPNRTRCDGFSYFQLFVSSTVNETRSNSIPQLAHSEKLNLVFEQLDDVQMMRQCFAFGGSLRRARRYIMILDCMITGPVFWGPVAGFRAAESGWLLF